QDRPYAPIEGAPVTPGLPHCWGHDVRRAGVPARGGCRNVPARAAGPARVRDYVRPPGDTGTHDPAGPAAAGHRDPAEYFETGPGLTFWPLWSIMGCRSGRACTVFAAPSVDSKETDHGLHAGARHARHDGVDHHRRP